MSISKYEAAILYDCNSSHMDAQCLILDFDDCSYGFCRCNNRGETELLHSWASIRVDLWNLCVEAVKKSIGDAYPFDISHELLNQLGSGNDVLNNYIISDRMMDADLFHFSGHTITCGEFENLLSDVKAKLEELFSHISKQLNADTLANSNVIILGRAQQIFLLTYYVKEYLSADPLLPDERFRNTEFKDPFDKIVKIGMDLYESRGLIKHTYSLMLFDKEPNSIEELLSLKKGQKCDSLQNIEYIGPVLLTKNDLLTIQIDGKNAEIKVPYSFEPLESDLIDLGFGMQGDQVLLSIRRCRFPSRIYSVVLG